MENDEMEVIEVVQIGKTETIVRNFDNENRLVNETVTSVAVFQPRMTGSENIGMYL